jgi:ABC-type dipeptide/oligopeptide/nickel transport system permease component
MTSGAAHEKMPSPAAIPLALSAICLGYALQFMLGVRLGLFPVTVSPQAAWYELILPAFVLGSTSLAYLARLMRTNLAENVRSDYVRTAKAKGLPNSLHGSCSSGFYHGQLKRCS